MNRFTPGDPFYPTPWKIKLYAICDTFVWTLRLSSKKGWQLSKTDWPNAKSKKNDRPSTRPLQTHLTNATTARIFTSIESSVCVLFHLPRPIFEVELDRHLPTLNSSMTRQAPLLDSCPQKRSFYIGMSNGRRSRIFCTRRVRDRPCRSKCRTNRRYQSPCFVCLWEMSVPNFWSITSHRLYCSFRYLLAGEKTWKLRRTM